MLVQYAKLSLWPNPLIFDYGTEILAFHFSEVPFSVAAVMVAFAVALASWRWSRPLGFLATSSFLLLAPTSSIVPVAMQPMAESRMYLPLAAVMTLVALGFHVLMGRRAVVLLAVIAAGLGGLSFNRNRDYQTAIRIWSDTLAKHPQTSRGENCLGLAYSRLPHRESEAIAHFEQALRINPGFLEANVNLANELEKLSGLRPTLMIGHGRHRQDTRP